MDENVSINLNEEEVTTLEDIKTSITQDVMDEISQMGYKIIEDNYDGAGKIADLVDKAQKLRASFNDECSRIRSRYRDDIVTSKINVLEMDLKYDLESLETAIDEIVETDKVARLKAIEELQKSEEYKVNRKECLEMLALLKDIDVPYDIFMDTIKDVVEAKDESTLRIIKLLAGKSATNTYIVDQALKDISVYKDNAHLKNFSVEAKKYLKTGDVGLSLFSYMKGAGK